MATGENYFLTTMVAIFAICRHEARLRVLQLDCALSYGLVEYKRFLDLLPEHGFSMRDCIPHGGHQMSLNIAAGLGLGGNESYPQVFILSEVLRTIQRWRIVTWVCIERPVWGSNQNAR